MILQRSTLSIYGSMRVTFRCVRTHKGVLNVKFCEHASMCSDTLFPVLFNILLVCYLALQ